MTTKKQDSIPAVRHPYSRARTFTRVRGQSKTHQSHATTCDINNIIRRFDNTGLLPEGRENPQYADVTQLQGTDLTERINQSREILDKAGRAMEEKRRSDLEAEKQRQVDLEEEVKRLRAESEKNDKVKKDIPEKA